MLAAMPDVVGEESADSWTFALKVLWKSGFRVGDLVDFSWDDDRHLHPCWPDQSGQHATIVVPSSKKNGKVQEIPLLPELSELLRTVDPSLREGWIVDPRPMHYEIKDGSAWFRPSDSDLPRLGKRFSNLSIAAACGVTDTTVRKWLKQAGIRREREFKRRTGAISAAEIDRVRSRAVRRNGRVAQRKAGRMTVKRVSEVIALIGKAAGVVVQKADARTGARLKYASAHDLRRGCAQRLINAGVSAETLKVVMRHADFATTERHYGATRSAQSAATKLQEKLSTVATSDALVGGLMGGHEKTPQLDAAELLKRKRLLEAL